MYDVLRRKPWFYRADVVSLRKVHDSTHLTSNFVQHILLWTQFHQVPPNLCLPEGIIYLAEQIGVPRSKVHQDYYVGHLYIRAKISYPLLSHLRWIIGNGDTCLAYDQLWFEGWKDLPAATLAQRSLKVQALFSPVTAHLHMPTLMQFGGLATCLSLLSMIP